MPVHTIASNAGVEGSVVVGKLLEQDNPDLGFDASKGCLHKTPNENKLVDISFCLYESVI